jgi:hypothetical protein
MSNKIQYCSQWVVSQFNAEITDIPLYAGLAPEDLCHPFVVYDIVADTATSDFCTEYSQYSVNFKVFDTEQNLSMIYSIMGEIRDAFDNIQAVEADTIIEMSRYNNSYMVRDENNQGWMGIVNYIIYMH